MKYCHKGIVLLVLFCSMAFHIGFVHAGSTSINAGEPKHLYFSATISGLTVDQDDLDFATLNTGAVTHDVRSISPHPHLAPTLRIGYLFTNQRSYMQLAWQYFKGDDQASIKANAGQTISPPFEISSPLALISGQGKVTFKHQSVDLLYGHILQHWPNVTVEFPFGFRYFRRENATQIQYRTVNNAIITVTPQSQYYGVGPTIKGIFSYHLNHGWTVIGRVGTALLLGNSSTEDTHTNSNAGVVLRLQKNRIFRVVPEIDAKLGLQYTCSLASAQQLTIEGGYRVADYINSVDRISPVFNDAFTLLATTRSRSSYMISGAYVKLSVLT